MFAVPPRWPSITPMSGVQDINLNEPATFTCTFPGSLPITITWRTPLNVLLSSSQSSFTLNQTLLTQTTSDNVPMTQGTLQISAVQRDMNGIFKCMAQNDGGNLERNLSLLVNGEMWLAFQVLFLHVMAWSVWFWTNLLWRIISLSFSLFLLQKLHSTGWGLCSLGQFLVSAFIFVNSFLQVVQAMLHSFGKQKKSGSPLAWKVLYLKRRDQSGARSVSKPEYCNPGNFGKLTNFINWPLWRFISY